jgi:ABC-type transport system substrate-binding protein/DNA-binding SARP family transcriptional activator
MLGPLEARLGDQQVSLGGQRQRSVLACLLLEPGRAVPSDRIADAVWDGRPPSGVQTTLQTYVFHLRAALEPSRIKGAGSSVITTVPGGYRLETTAATIDALRFEELVTAGRSSLAADPAGASDLLTQALALWRGDVLEDLVSMDGFVAPVAGRLEESRAAATELWVEAEMALGHDVLGTLHDLVLRYPLREHLAAMRMLALYRAGRQADALAAYRQLRRTLDDELGIQPSAQVETLHQRVLQQDPSLDLVLPPPPDVIIATTPPPEPAAAARAGGSRSRRRGGLSRRGWAVVTSVVIVAATALVGSTFLARRGLTPMPANSVGAIDAYGLTGDAVLLDSAPSALTSGGGAVWAALDNADAVVKIDPATRKVLQTVTGVDGSPQAMAASGDDLWVAGFDDGVLTRINMPTGIVVGKVPVGIGPAAVLAGPGGVWVANSADNTVQFVNAETGRAGPAIPVGDGPDALALDGSTLWVANGRSGTLSQVDTRTGQPAASDVRVDAGPAALALTATDIWVANEFSQTVSRMSRSSGRVQRIYVADGPSDLVVHQGQVWVTNHFSASVSRIDIDTNAVHEEAVGGAPAALTVVGGEMWAAAGAYAKWEHVGGTLVWTGPGLDIHELDPAVGLIPMYVNLIRVAYDGLVAQPLTGGRSSLTVVPDLAANVPEPSDGGRTYVFEIRPDIRYSTGAYVQPSDFLRGFERVLRPDTGAGEPFEGIIGAATCMTPDSVVCDLHAGVEPDDRNGRLTIHLTKPDPLFLDKLTNSVYPRPAGSPTGAGLATALPSTGPYQVASVDHGSVTLTRNPYFDQWSAAAQPQGYPDVIVYRPYVSERAGLADVLAGRAHASYVFEDLPASVTSRPGMTRTYDQAQVQYVFPNVTQPPFDDVRVRQALSFALDRRRIAEIAGAHAACQLLPASFPGFRPYCPHQSGPAGGPYQGPDLARARQLVAESGTAGMAVTVHSRVSSIPAGIARYTASVLADLGYRVDVREIPDEVDESGDPYFDTAQLTVPLGWVADYPSPETFYSFVGSCQKVKLNRYCNPEIEANAERARSLSLTDPIRALANWAEVDRMLVDAVAMIPTDSQIGTVVISPEVGNLLLRPAYGPILDQMWVK